MMYFFAGMITGTLIAGIYVTVAAEMTDNEAIDEAYYKGLDEGKRLGTFERIRIEAALDDLEERVKES